MSHHHLVCVQGQPSREGGPNLTLRAALLHLRTAHDPHTTWPRAVTVAQALDPVNFTVVSTNPLSV
jgi:hypothetical protein